MNPLEVFVPISFSNLDKFSADLNSIKDQLESKLGGGLMKGLGMLGLVTGIGATVAMAISKAMESEEKLHDLKDTLAATGQAVDSNVTKFKALAAAIAQTTTVSKGQVLGLIEQGLKMGLSSADAAQASSRALGLSKRLGIDATEAMELLSRSESKSETLSNRALMALGRYSTEIANATTKQGKLDAANRAAAQGMEMQRSATETSEGKWQKLHQTIGSLYTRFGTMLLPVVSKIIGALSGFFDWISQLATACSTFQAQSDASFSAVGNIVSYVGDIFSWLVSTWKAGYETIAYAITNWQLSFKVAGTAIALEVVTIGERIWWFAQQVPIALNWVRENFFDIFKTIGNFVVTIFTNLATNLKSIWSGVLSFVSGKGFHVDFTDLTKGFKSEIKKMPEFTKFEHSGMGKALADDLSEASKQWGKGRGGFLDEMNKAKPNLEQAKALVDASMGLNTSDLSKKTGTGGGFTGLAESWKRAQEGIMKSGADKKAEQDRQRTREAAERTAKATEKMAAKPQYAVAK